MRALLVDDEFLALEELEYLLESHDQIEVVAKAQSGEEALSIAAKLQPDVVFLDIQMPDLDGISVALELKQMDKKPFIIFATAYDSYAVKGFELHALDYLLKPFNAERVKQSVERLKDQRDKDSNLETRFENLIKKMQRQVLEQKLIVEKNGRMYPMKQNDIVYLSRENREVVLHTREQTFTMPCNLGEVRSKLDNELFYRTHRSYVVNLECIAEIQPWFNGSYQLLMCDGDKSIIPVSRAKVPGLKERLNI